MSPEEVEKMAGAFHSIRIQLVAFRRERKVLADIVKAVVEGVNLKTEASYDAGRIESAACAAMEEITNIIHDAALKKHLTEGFDD